MGAKMFGARVARLEDPKLLTGQGGYTDDMHLPGMLEAAFVRSPHSHARIKDINISDALKHKGVCKFTLRLTCRIICVILLYLFKCQILRYRNHSNSVYLRIERSVLQGNPSPLLLPIQDTTPKMPQPWFKLTMIFYPGQLIVSPLSRTVHPSVMSNLPIMKVQNIRLDMAMWPRHLPMHT